MSTAPGPPEDSLVRRKADQALVERLAARGWAGPEYVLLEARLLDLGTKALHKWIGSGEIYRRCFEVGRSLERDQRAKDELRERADERESVVGEAVTLAWNRFREHALIGGGWKCEGGTTLASYFVGAVLFAFAEVHRRWYRRYRLEQMDLLLGDGLPEAAYGSSPAADEVFRDGEAGVAMAEEMIAKRRPGLPPERRRVLAKIAHGRSCGLTDREIGDLLGLSADAVAMRMARFRKGLDDGQ
ncbi:hypothetical protein [Kitasatospora sp. NPDC093806]|uniref:hypothetical protein n=1 Tax=Kitasatospora sp. NPDC093806 TaxID=3155075 RepID=UPI00344444F9